MSSSPLGRVAADSSGESFGSDASDRGDRGGPGAAADSVAPLWNQVYSAKTINDRLAGRPRPVFAGRPVYGTESGEQGIRASGAGPFT
ncbi:hypothetical protein HPB50_004718 [Hyalomma asiaticum]|uniref:Uncharacterized protein n=1 Tax=Hyalomma asiaticum TaxID=266040 RepID=A0ACB7SVN4_HYAAI|nr:hypothetical protein HPB50_004718 [Hyalomma asiaticum]